MKTTKFFLAAIIFLFAVSAQAQDVITLKTGEEINAKVSEVSISEIKYKRTENLNGPIYTIRKSDVLFIKYENGTKDVFAMPAVPLSKQGNSKCDKLATADYNTLNRAYRKHLGGGIAMTAVGAYMIPPGIALSVIGMGVSGTPFGGYHHDEWGVGSGAPLLATGAVLLAGGITLAVLGSLKIKLAKHYKAKAKELSPTIGFAPVIGTDNYAQSVNAGAGVRINF